MQIREATLADLDDIVRLKQLLVATAWSDDLHVLDSYPDYESRLRARVAELLQHPDHQFWVAFDGEEIVACLSASLAKHLPGPDWSGIHGHLSDLYVAETHRGQGIAKELMHIGVDWLRDRGAWGADLHATRMALPMYEAMGWERRQADAEDSTFFSLSKRFDDED